MIVELTSEIPKEYWKYVCNIEIRQERKQPIPWQVVTEDGSDSYDKHNVLQNVRKKLQGLYNPDTATTPQTQ